MPFKGRGIMPAEGVDSVAACGIGFQGFGGAKGHDGGCEIVVPGTCVGVAFRVSPFSVRTSAMRSMRRRGSGMWSSKRQRRPPKTSIWRSLFRAVAFFACMCVVA